MGLGTVGSPCKKANWDCCSRLLPDAAIRETTSVMMGFCSKIGRAAIDRSVSSELRTVPGNFLLVSSCAESLFAFLVGS